MKLDQLPISWVDFVTAIVLLIGIIRGRKRGLSEECLDTLQWLTIIVVGGLYYGVVGSVLNQRPLLSLVTYYVISYILIALVITLFFTMIRRRIGQKLIEGDIFGRFEYYLGMMAGGIRFACMYLFVLSLLHAPYYSDEYRAAKAKSDAYNYGSDFFPSIMSIQDEVFKVSYTGKSADRYLMLALIQPTSTESKPLRGENSMAKRRERAVDAVLRQK